MKVIGVYFILVKYGFRISDYIAKFANYTSAMVVRENIVSYI
jgi:hypothetical protein